MTTPQPDKTGMHILLKLASLVVILAGIHAAADIIVPLKSDETKAISLKAIPQYTEENTREETPDQNSPRRHIVYPLLPRKITQIPDKQGTPLLHMRRTTTDQKSHHPHFHLAR